MIPGLVRVMTEGGWEYEDMEGTDLRMRLSDALRIESEYLRATHTSISPTHVLYIRHRHRPQHVLTSTPSTLLHPSSTPHRDEDETNTRTCKQIHHELRPSHKNLYNISHHVTFNGTLGMEKLAFLSCTVYFSERRSSRDLAFTRRLP